MEITGISTRTNERRTIVFENDVENLKLNFVWDSHGKYVDWNECVNERKSYKKAHVVLEHYEFTENFKYTGPIDFEAWQLTVDGHKIAGDVVSDKGKVDENGKVISMTVKIAVGCG